ncbi:hypothetical protein ABK040_009170 [Willaertia magna]
MKQTVSLWKTLTRKFHISLLYQQSSITKASDVDSYKKQIASCSDLRTLEQLKPDIGDYSQYCCGNACVNCVMNDYFEMDEYYEKRKKELEQKEN